ncbi:MAG: GspE/PulE family protein [Syntrophomonadaceae bacterium]
MKRMMLGEKLLNSGLINKEQLEEALQEQKQSGDKLGRILVRRGIISEHQLLEMLEFILGIPYVVLTKMDIAPDAVALLPPQLIRKHRVLPVAVDNGRITLAMIDPLNFEAIDDVCIYTGLDVLPIIVSEKEMELAIQQISSLRFDSKMEQLLGELRRDEPAAVLQISPVEDAEDDAPIIRMVNSIMSQAVQARASDIHIEPQESHVRVRFRIDGELFEVLELPKKSMAAVASRLKIMANLDISEKRLPQDGRTRIMVDGREVDFRISSLPSIMGEKMVLRVLDRASALYSLEDLGFSLENLEMMNSIIRRPHGMILVTGPTGSGKTTTMYSILIRINSVGKNMVTLEDPVEYALPGINQVQINLRAGLTFPAGLRSILRQDPDIIMVGEMRDNETAQLGVRAALTGHLLLSTVHTNSAAGTMARMVNMGIENYLLSSSLAGIVSQRLVRRLCSNCRQPYQLEEGAARRMGLDGEEKRGYYRAQGCSMCLNTGYMGRLALHEVLVLGPEIRQAINSGVNSEDVLHEIALREGMISIRQDGVKKARAGLTSLEEVMKVVYLGA